MSDSKYVILGGLILLTILGSTWSIKCWVCNSEYDPRCGDPFDNTTFPISDCNSAEHLKPNLGNIIPTMCRKTVQKVQGKWRYIRGCAFLGEPGIGGDERYCRRYTGTYDIYIEDCTCRSKDGCNSSPVTTSSAAMLSLIAALARLIIPF